MISRIRGKYFWILTTPKKVHLASQLIVYSCNNNTNKLWAASITEDASCVLCFPPPYCKINEILVSSATKLAKVVTQKNYKIILPKILEKPTYEWVIHLNYLVDYLNLFLNTKSKEKKKKNEITPKAQVFFFSSYKNSSFANSEVGFNFTNFNLG